MREALRCIFRLTPPSWKCSTTLLKSRRRTLKKNSETASWRRFVRPSVSSSSCSCHCVCAKWSFSHKGDHWPLSALYKFVHLNVTLSTEVKSTWTHHRGSCCWLRRRTMWSTLVTAPCWRGWRRLWLAPSMRRTFLSTTTLWGTHDKNISLFTSVM